MVFMSGRSLARFPVLFSVCVRCCRLLFLFFDVSGERALCHFYSSGAQIGVIGAFFILFLFLGGVPYDARAILYLARMWFSGILDSMLSFCQWR
ncbi:hypothetical protein F5B21DRAFT_486507 [Xylaria acuta]|nr:hypothetical protein F5B21DRAFT_486507 [Xylaria acuta]